MRARYAGQRLMPELRHAMKSAKSVSRPLRAYQNMRINENIITVQLNKLQYTRGNEMVAGDFVKGRLTF